jgi:hypothetical protein
MTSRPATFHHLKRHSQSISSSTLTAGSPSVRKALSCHQVRRLFPCLHESCFAFFPFLSRYACSRSPLSHIALARGRLSQTTEHFRSYDISAPTRCIKLASSAFGAIDTLNICCTCVYSSLAQLAHTYRTNQPQKFHPRCFHRTPKRSPSGD